MRSTVLLSGLLCLCFIGTRPQHAVAPPNILLIVSDDHAWSDYGFMGHPVVRTPSLDTLASEGMLFTRGYVPTALCRPSLATILTGLYPHQHGITGNDPPGGAAAMVDPARRAALVDVFRRNRTLPALLAGKGYVSFQSGKWWEGRPQDSGFTAGMTHGDVTRRGRHGDDGLTIGREGLQPIYDFIDSAGGKPFLVWYAPMLPHTPHTPPARLLKKYETLDLAPPVVGARGPRMPAPVADERLVEFGPDTPTLPRFHVWTLGCQMNRSDSEEMAGRLLAAGCAEAATMDEADLVIINTCAIREAAEAKVVGRQGHLKRLKAVNPGMRVVLTGCAVRERDRAGLRDTTARVLMFRLQNQLVADWPGARS